MGLFFYTLVTQFYYLAINFSSLFNVKARKWVEGRKDIFRILEDSFHNESKNIWFHCASLGEFEQGRPVMEEFRKTYPDYKILLTFFSPSGYEVRKNYPGADYVFYLPFDSRSNAKRFMEIVNPRIVFFVKYELWYHYLNALQEKNIPHFIISGNFRENQFFFRWYGKWFLPVLKKITSIFLQTNQAVLMMRSKGFSNVEYSGDTRFDRVLEIAHRKKLFPLIEEFIMNSFVLVAGSTWPEDENLFAKLINCSKSGTEYHELFTRLKIIIAPHEIVPARIKKLQSSIKAPSVVFSKAETSDISGAKVLIIDSIGHLSSLYRYASIVYIGGGFGKGIHNILEAAVWEKPVVIGPNHQKFREATDLVESGGAFPVNNYREFEDRIRFLMQNEMILKMAGLMCKHYVRNNAGATKRIIEKIMSYLKS